MQDNWFTRQEIIDGYGCVIGRVTRVYESEKRAHENTARRYRSCEDSQYMGSDMILAGMYNADGHYEWL